VTRRYDASLLGLAIALALADSSIVTLALPDMLRAFDVPIADVAWVLTSYNLVLAGAAVPAAFVARRFPRATLAGGLLLFSAASLGCGLAPTFAVLLTARCVQAVGGAAIVGAALNALVAVRGSERAAASTWAAAGVLGAALGPVVGGVLTQLLGWEWIFLAQAAPALLPLIALIGARFEAPLRGPVGRPHVVANTALLLASAALSAALFLLVILLVNGFRLQPAAAGAVVTAIPLAAVVSARLAHRIGSPVMRAACGLVLAAGGLAALGELPRSGWQWTLPPQLLIGAGLGLTVLALTDQALAGRSPQAVHGGWTIASRHAGVVLGLVLMTPLLTASLDRNTTEAERASAAIVLDSKLPPLEKLGIAQDALRAVHDADGRLPDVSAVLFDRAHGDNASEVRRLAAALQSQLDRAVTRAFSRPFLLAAALALAALAVVTAGRRVVL
jgi:MFS family permease